MSFQAKNIQVTPAFFDILDEEDKQQYWALHDFITNSGRKYKRYQRVESLKESLYLIQKYCIRQDSNDWKRCLICGIFWTQSEMLLINNHQLTLLVNKCKSSINDAISKMGYNSFPCCSSDANKIINDIPLLKGKLFEQKQWTVRKKVKC